MNTPVTIAALSSRYNADHRASLGGAGSGPAARIARAFDAIGWRSAGGDSSEDIAASVAAAIGACVAGRRDLSVLARDIADLMRQGMAGLDGSLPSVSDFIPAAQDVLRRYVAGTPEA